MKHYFIAFHTHDHEYQLLLNTTPRGSAYKMNIPSFILRGVNRKKYEC